MIESPIFTEDLAQAMRRADGHMIEIVNGITHEIEFISVRSGIDSQTGCQVLLVDIFENNEPIGHYDWLIATDSPPLPPYANGNTGRHKSFVGTQNTTQETARTFWNPADGVDVIHDKRRQGIGKLLVISSVLAINARSVPHICLGALSPSARALWDSFQSQQYPVQNPFGRGINPYAPAEDWVDAKAFLVGNTDRIHTILNSAAKK